MTEDEILVYDDNGDDPTATVLILHDDSTDCASALMVGRKGTDERASGWVLQGLEELGHFNDIVLKSDQEEAILAFKKGCCSRPNGEINLCRISSQDFQEQCKG